MESFLTFLGNVVEDQYLVYASLSLRSTHSHRCVYVFLDQLSFTIDLVQMHA